MQTTFFFLLVTTFVAATEPTAVAKAVQNTLPAHGHLQGSHVVKQHVDLGQEEERGAIQALVRFKGIFGKHPNKAAKLTTNKLQKIKTYAKENPNKWEQMEYYLTNVYGISLMALLAGGSFFLGWRYAGAGTSQ